MKIVKREGIRICTLRAQEVYGEYENQRWSLIAVDEHGDRVEVWLDLLHLADFFADAEIPVQVDGKGPHRLTWDPKGDTLAIWTEPAETTEKQDQD